MSDLLRRSQEAMRLINDPSLPNWERLPQALQAYSGLELTEISGNVRSRLEADLARVNHLLEPYALENEEDYQNISGDDLKKMLRLVDRAAMRAITAELDRIVTFLDEGDTRLPVEAMLEAREHRDLMVPRLIGVLADAVLAARNGDTPNGNAHFFAVFLLTEFCASEAFPVILDAFSLPGELPFDLFGDAVTSTLSRILAVFAAKRPEALDALIIDPSVNEYVRWEAAQSYVYLVRDGQLHRNEAVRRLTQHLEQAIEERNKVVSGGLVTVLASFSTKEVLDVIKQAYELGLIDPLLISLREIEEGIAKGTAERHDYLKRCPATGIPDAIEELRHWASFKVEPPHREASPNSPPHFAMDWELDEPVTVPELSRAPRIGRNDPCSCGSGKKFKKCCGARR